MSVKIKHLNIVLQITLIKKNVVHNYFNVENITTYYTLKKNPCAQLF